MVENSEEIGGDITIKNDQEYSHLVIFLRNSKINKLPQLINIIIGDMSIVGFDHKLKNSLIFSRIPQELRFQKNRPG